MNILISIIVTVYNLQEYISECLDSIINQTYKNIEVIIIDDGSTDKSSEICDQYAKKDKRIRVYHIKNTGMASKARNIGIELAKGDFIGFIDGDDYIKEDMYEDLINACIRNGCNISCCGITRFNEEDRIDIKTTSGLLELSSLNAKKEILSDGIIGLSVCSKLFNKNLINDIRFREIKYNEDLYFVWECLNKSKKIIHIGEAKYNYRLRNYSVSKNSKYDTTIKSIISNAERLYELSDENIREYIGLYIFKVNYVLLISLQKSKESKKYSEDIKYYKKIFKRYMKYYFNNSMINNKDKLRAILAYCSLYELLYRIVRI